MSTVFDRIEQVTAARPEDRSSAPVVYAVDARDRIVKLNDAWHEFAITNGAPQTAEHVLGTSLWDHVTGAEVTMLWRDLLARARAGHTLAVPFRCDAPGERRELEMVVVPAGDGGLTFISLSRSTFARRPLIPAADGDVALITCSWCNRFLAPAGWVEVEEAVAELGLFEGEPPPLTHTLCPSCDVRVRAEAGL